MSTAEALVTAMNNSDPGDIILIELHAPGPHYDFEERDDQLGYVPMEYWQENFDAIQQASALGMIVVEAGGNGAENLSDTSIYGQLFDPDYRHSGAIMVAASDENHYPAGFTNHGERLDVHAFGTWNVYTLGYGDLYGSSPDDYYTATFAGTSSASPIIVGACAALQGMHLAVHGWTMDHNEIRSLLTTYSTPQAPHPKPIGPLPDLAGAASELVGVSFAADTTVGWVPLEVDFTASSGLAVDSWTWDFGDGDSASIQNPTHVYDSRGRFDVTLEIEAEGDVRNVSRPQYIAALADSLNGDSVQVELGEVVEVVISATNTLPLDELEIPVEYDGEIDLALAPDYWSTVGCRTENMDDQEVVHLDPFNKRMTFKLANQAGDDLPAGQGPVLKLYFEIDSPPSVNQATEIALDGYSTREPWFRSDILDYQPALTNPVVAYSSCCTGIRGNVDGDPSDEINISDLVYLSSYMFGGGPEPPCLKEANANGDIFEQVDIEDLVYLVSYMFSGGPAPVVCF
jgi:PKD repeat protein